MRGLFCALFGCLTLGPLRAAPIPIDLNDFIALPGPPEIVVAADGSSATFTESINFGLLVLSNDPALGDPAIIDTGASAVLFDYTFIEPAGNTDEFGAFLIDPASGLPVDPLDPGRAFFAADGGSGSVSLDLVGLTFSFAGLQFELTAFDVITGSSLIVSDVRLETTTAVPEPPAWSLLLSAATLLLAWCRSIPARRSA
ncbi:hypothetical protein CKO40_03490 [Halochromatium glycolicum]|uniref:PEP-CTERM protein-sorting domain-containing protein n=2 Tax=Halochromatium glycolicum TaxID=85075 RepID=A0AAJ0U1N7_9GAMM|nr:hypothetical protein [Halochromatium glycolicum]